MREWMRNNNWKQCEKLWFLQRIKGKRIEHSIEVDGCSWYESSGWLQMWTVIFMHWMNEGQNQSVIRFSFEFDLHHYFTFMDFVMSIDGRVWSVASGKWNWIWCFELNDTQKDGKIAIVVMAFGPHFAKRKKKKK